MIMEIRAVNKLRLIEEVEIKSTRKYEKTCKKVLKMVQKYDKKHGSQEFLMRVRPHSFLVKSGDYGFVVGLKQSKSRWL